MSSGVWWFFGPMTMTSRFPREPAMTASPPSSPIGAFRPLRAVVAVLLGVVLLFQVVYLSHRPRAAAEGPTPTRRHPDDPRLLVDPTHGYGLRRTSWADPGTEEVHGDAGGWLSLEGAGNPGIGDLEFAVVER